MDVMALGALDQIAQPMGRRDIGVLKHGVERQEQGGNAPGLDGQAQQGEHHQAADTGENSRVKRMQIEGPQRVQTLRTVVHLVPSAP